MRTKYLIVSIAGLLVLSCSTATLLPATPTLFVPVAQPTETLSHSAVASPLPTSTFTATPTVSVMTATEITSTPAETSTATVTITAPALTASPAATLPATPTFPILATPQSAVFQLVSISNAQIDWGDTCQTKPVTVIIQVASGNSVSSVLLFTRLQSQNGDISTVWNDAVSMHDDGLGTFSYDLSTKVIKFYQNFNQAWVQYQFVASNNLQQEVGRTQVYAHTLTIARCP